ncbi:acyltransferase family protein [Asticcacaulis solisilvae]|uniref:acyltransferase family protein n=1 Tax=Asticcacaulis solisilvae TaxID=1217274 RepID=UPI003FD790E8
MNDEAQTFAVPAESARQKATPKAASAQPDAPAKSTKDKIHSIQYLRIVAALMVVFQHSIHEVDQVAAKGHFGITNLTVDGVFGVKIFFVISGFIMHALAKPRLKTPGYWWKFLVERFLRIAPMYWIATTLFLCAATLFSSQVNHAAMDPLHVLASYGFVPYPRPGDQEMSPVLALGWSLNYEMFFYVLFGACIFLNTRSITLACTAAFVLVAALHGFTPQATAPHYLSKPIILLFLAGALISYLHQVIPQRLNLPSWAFLAIIAVLVGIKQAFVPVDGPIQEEFPLAIALVAAAAFIRINDDQTIVSRVLTTGGDASFSLYLFHIFAINGVILIAKKLHLLAKIGTYPVLGLCIVASLATGYLVYRYLEIPILSWTVRVRKSLFGFVSKPQP